MPLRINNNIAALNARRNMNANFRDQELRLERLSSGLRVNRAADDAAGLSVREGMRAELSGLRQNVPNAEQGSNLLQVAEGSLNEINAIRARRVDSVRIQPDHPGNRPDLSVDDLQ